MISSSIWYIWFKSISLSRWALDFCVYTRNDDAVSMYITHSSHCYFYNIKEYYEEFRL